RGLRIGQQRAGLDLPASATAAARARGGAARALLTAATPGRNKHGECADGERDRQWSSRQLDQEVPPSGWDNERAALQAHRRFSSRDERPREVRRIEWPEVVQALPDPDQFHWKPELVRDRDRDPTLGRAVELGQSDSAHLDRLAEEPRLRGAGLP